jgi:hypothetical protein
MRPQMANSSSSNWQEQYNTDSLLDPNNTIIKNRVEKAEYKHAIIMGWYHTAGFDGFENREAPPACVI